MCVCVHAWKEFTLLASVDELHTLLPESSRHLEDVVHFARHGALCIGELMGDDGCNDVAVNSPASTS